MRHNKWDKCCSEVLIRCEHASHSNGEYTHFNFDMCAQYSTPFWKDILVSYAQVAQPI